MNIKVENIKKFLVTLLSGFVVLSNSACTSVDDTNEEADTTTSDYNDIEQKVFDAWVEAKLPEIVDSRQESGYYVQILKNEPDASYPATNKTSCWVEYNITSRDLDGNVTNTRNELMAIQQNTFSLYTRYVPAKTYLPLNDNYVYEDEDKDAEKDVFTQALRAQELVIDGVSTPVKFTVGSKIRLWAPSRLATATLSNGVAGFGGQSSWGGNHPVAYDIEITNVVVDAENNEREVLDWFIESQETPSDWEIATDENCDRVYINHNYTPNTKINYKSPYNYTQLDRAANFEELESKVNAILIDQFGEGLTPTRDEDDLIDGATCSMWYITRTLDGFIVDTNIEEIKSLIRNSWEYDTENYGTTLNYGKDSNADSFISAFYYTIPKLEYGQWATMVTSSLEAYDIDGQSGSTTATAVDPYTSLIFQLYILEDE